MDTHPYNAPLAYVQPTADMQIKVSMYVDHNGKIYLPYLHDWNPVSAQFNDFHSSSEIFNENHFHYSQRPIYWALSKWWSSLLVIFRQCIQNQKIQ